MLSAATNWTSTGFGGGGGFFVPAVSPSSTTSAVVANVTSDMGDLFQTTNSGGSWTMVNFPAFVSNPYSQVQFSAGGVEYVQGSSSEFKSTNGGVSWTKVANSLNGTIDQLLADTNNNQNICVSVGNSVYFSTNGGSTFTAFTDFTPDPASLANAQADGSNDGAWIGGIYSYTPSGGSEIIYVSTNNENGNLYESTNGGTSFSIVPISGGLTLGSGTDIHSFAGSMAPGATTPTLYALPLWAGDSNGYALSSHGGGTEYPYGGTQVYTLTPNGSNFEWTAVGNAMATNYHVNGMAVDPTNPNIIYLTGNYTPSNGNLDQDIVLTSVLNTSGTWSGAWTNLYDPGGSTNGTTPEIPNVNVTTGAEGDNNDYDYGGIGQFKEVAIDPLNPQIVMVNSESTVMLSTNGGATWTTVVATGALNTPGTGSQGEPFSSTINDTSVWSADFIGPSVIDAGQSDVAMEQSVDGGVSWAEPVYSNGFPQKTITDYGVFNAIYNTAYDPTTGITYGSIANQHDLYDPSKSQPTPGAYGALGVSTDLGHTWTLLAPPAQSGGQTFSGGTIGPDFDSALRYVYVDPNDPTGDTVYALVYDTTSSTTQTYAPGGSNTNGNLGGVWVTHNIQAGESATWYQLANPTGANDRVLSMQVLADNTLVVVYSTETEEGNAPGGSGVYYLPGSLNGPTSTYSTVTPSSWVDATPVSEATNITGLPSGSTSSAVDETLSLTVDPSDSTQSTWFLSSGTVGDDYGGGEYGGVWKTTNRGATWTLYWNTATYGDGFGGPSGVAINPMTDEMYISTLNDGMFYTSNYNSATPTFSADSSFPFWNVSGGVEFDPYNPNEVIAMTEGAGIVIGYEQPANPAPANLAVTANNSSGSQTITVNWTASDPNATYEVDYTAAPTDYGTGTNLIIGDPGSSLPVTWTAAATGLSPSVDSYTFTTSKLTPGVQYAFRIVAVDSGVRTDSNSLAGTILPAPTNVVATGIAGVNGTYEDSAAGYYDNLIPGGTPQINVTWSGLSVGNTEGVTGYLVQYSTDGVTWTTGKDAIYETSNQAASGQFLGFGSTEATMIVSEAELNSSGQYSFTINDSDLEADTGYYIRVTPIAPSPANASTGTYDSVAYTEATTGTPTTALNRSGWTASDYVVADGGGTGTAKNAIDGDPNIVLGNPSTYTSANETVWSSNHAEQSGDWFQVNMGSTQTFDEITMTDDQFPAQVKNWGGNAYSYTVEVSANGTTWTSLTINGSTTVSNSGGLPIDVTFAPQSDQYIRILLDSANGNWWSIDEFNVYNSAAAPASTNLPMGWSDTDIGSPAKAGSATFNATTQTYTVNGNGSDIWYQSSEDQLNYAYTTLTGNGQIIAEVDSQLNTDPHSKVGVMFMNSTAQYSSYAIAAFDPSTGAVFESANNSSTSNSDGTNSGFSSSSPEWVKLVRVGQVFTAFVSSNGDAWTELGSVTISSMNSTLDVGLEVESNNTTNLNTGVFSNVSVTALPSATGQLLIDNRSGTSIKQVVIPSENNSSTTTFTSSNVNNPYDLSLGSDGYIYVANLSGGTVSRFSTSGTFLDSLTLPNPGTSVPTSVVEYDGYLYVADRGNSEVYRYTVSAPVPGNSSMPATAAGTASGNPAWITGDTSLNDLLINNGQLYVSDYSGTTGYVDLYGNITAQLTAPTLIDSAALNGASGMAIGPNNVGGTSLYVSNGAGSIDEYDLALDANSFSTIITGLTTDLYGVTVAPAPDGTSGVTPTYLYVAEQDFGAAGEGVLAYNLLAANVSGSKVTVVNPSSPAGSNGLDGPMGMLYLPPPGQLLVSNDYGSSIQQVSGPSENNTTTQTWVNTGVSKPSDMSLGGDGYVYVAVSGSGTINRYTTSGAFVDSLTLPNPGTSNPTAVAEYGGFLYVADRGNSEIYRYSVSAPIPGDATMPATPAGLLGVYNPAWVTADGTVNGLIVSGGVLYVSDDSSTAGYVQEYNEISSLNTAPALLNSISLNYAAGLAVGPNNSGGTSLYIAITTGSIDAISPSLQSSTLTTIITGLAPTYGILVAPGPNGLSGNSSTYLYTANMEYGAAGEGVTAFNLTASSVSGSKVTIVDPSSPAESNGLDGPLGLLYLPPL